MLHQPIGEHRRRGRMAGTLGVIVALAALLAVILLLALAQPAHGAGDVAIWSGSMVDVIALIVSAIALVVAFYAAGRPYTHHHQ